MDLDFPSHVPFPSQQLMTDRLMSLLHPLSNLLYLERLGAAVFFYGDSLLQYILGLSGQNWNPVKSQQIGCYELLPGESYKLKLQS